MLYSVLEQNRFTLCILDEINGELKAIQELKGTQLLEDTQNLDRTLSNLKLTENDYQQHYLAIFTERNSLLPSSLPNKLEKLASLEIEEPSESETWLNKNVLSGKLNLIGVINRNVKELMERKIPNLKTFNLASVFLDERHRLSRFHKDIRAYWLVSIKSSYFCIFNNGELVFFNQFAINNSEDLLYYTLNVLEQLQIEPNEISLEISGQVKLIELNMDLVSEYIPKSNLCNEIQGLKTEYLNDAAIYRNQTLLNMFLCE